MSQLKVNSIVDAAGGSSAVLYGVASPPNSMGFRNRIINGDMRIDQRNNGASVATSSGLSIYSVDRWAGVYSQTSKYTMQQNAGGVTAPTGFKNYLGITSSSAYTVGATELFNLVQGIEGYNIADLNWGTANAARITISFWVRSSLTGTFGAVVANSAANRFYGFSYTISATNTWEYKTVTVAGDTTGTWATDNTAGVYLRFGLGVGASVSGAAGSWGSTVMWGVTGATSVVGTSGATFYITGVQLEAGTVATPFERRDYGRELMMCQRYYETGNAKLYLGSLSATTIVREISYKSTKRTGATLNFASPPTGGYFPPTIVEWTDTNGFSANRGSSNEIAFSWNASAEL